MLWSINKTFYFIIYFTINLFKKYDKSFDLVNTDFNYKNISKWYVFLALFFS